MKLLELLQRLLPYAIALLDRAREASWKRLLAWFAAVSLLGGAMIAGMNWLTWQQSDEGDRWTSQYVLNSRRSNLQFAHDTIGNCIKSRAESLPQQQWYCDWAITEYRKASEHLPQTHVEDVIQRGAFLAMQSAGRPLHSRSRTGSSDTGAQVRPRQAASIRAELERSCPRRRTRCPLPRLGSLPAVVAAAGG